MSKTTLYIGALLLLLAGFIYLSESPQRILGTSSALKSEVNAVPFSVAQGTTTTIYRENGEINYTFTSKRMEHYRQNQGESDVFTLIDSPKLVLYEESEPWHVKAAHGRLSSDNENIELWDEVSVLHTNEQGLITTINTERLIIDPVDKLAKTDKPVTISSDADHVKVEGVGMHADLVDKKLKLLSDVRGSYDPN